jgi:hypothetical protein
MLRQQQHKAITATTATIIGVLFLWGSGGVENELGAKLGFSM